MRKNSKENFKSLTAQSSTIWHNPRRPWEDMAYVLGGVDNITSKYVRLKYVREESQWEYVTRFVYKNILMKGWKFINESIPVRLAMLAVHEATGADMCRKCKGKGIISTGYTVIDCFVCEGSGVLKKTEAYRAKYIGVNLRTWKRIWQLRFRREVMGIFDIFEYNIERALRRRL